MELGKNHGFESLSHGSVFNSSIESKILSHLHVNNSIGRLDDYSKDGGEELFTKMHCVLITNP